MEASFRRKDKKNQLQVLLSGGFIQEKRQKKSITSTTFILANSQNDKRNLEIPT